MRTGAVRGIDLDDLDLDELALHFTQEPDTPLKNGTNGERWVALSESTTRTVDDYINGPADGPDRRLRPRAAADDA